ncbi:ras-related C3 botulinum toxin substrate 1-like isoform X2 [Daphnia carinata]|nr:ras-related C3 botulinum toxin substrate 1-like isoform X2 [Daphnia carinata]
MYALNIWDTAGQEDFDRLRMLSYPNTDVFVVCYAVNCRNSFTNLTAKWIPEITKHYPNAPFIVVGTKVDVRHASESEEDIISYRNGCHTAKQIGATYFVECSALNGTNVIEIFTKAAETALGLRRKPCIIL